MATRVNTTFVAMIAAGAIVVFGGLYFAYRNLVQNTPARLISIGDKQMDLAKQHQAAGKEADAQEAIHQAAIAYSKAVNKEQTNLGYLDKWEAALTKYAPTQQQAYVTSYNEYTALVRKRAMLRGTDVGAHRARLDQLYEQARAAPGGPDTIVRETDEALAHFATKPDPKAAVLRRYSGLALLREAQGVSDTPEAKMKRIASDLEAALKADPKDGEVAEGLATFHALASQRAKDLARDDDAKAEMAAAVAGVDQFLKDNPNHPRLMCVKARLALVKSREAFDAAPTREAKVAATEKIRTELKPLLDEVDRAIQSADPASLDEDVAQQLNLLESQLAPGDQHVRYARMLEKLSAARGSDPRVLLLAGDAASQRGEFDRAISQATKVIDMPSLPISREGMRLFDFKRMAAAARAGWALDAYDRAPEGEGRGKLLDAARSYRDALAKVVEEAQPSRKLVEARLAFSDRDYIHAARLFKEYNDATQDRDPKALLLAATTALRQASPQPGVARDLVQKVLQINGDYVPAYVLLGEIALNAGNSTEASRMAQAALEREPDNEQARRLAATLKGESTSDDPVVKALLDIQKIAKTPGKEGEVTAKLRQLAQDSKQDPRVVRFLAAQLAASGDRDGGAKAVEDGLKEHPGHPDLIVLQAQFSTKSPLEKELGVLDQTVKDALDLALARFNTFSRYGKAAEAKAELAKAVAVNPNDPRVIEVEFLTALNEKDFAKAGQLAEKATELNLDGADGLTFRARLLQNRGQLPEALTAVEDALKRTSPSAELYRLKGQILLAMGRGDDATEALARAVDIKPNDPLCMRDLVGCLLNIGRNNEALGVLRQRQGVTMSDSPLFETWLDLEASLGDRGVALDAREKMYKAEPENRSNAIAIASLYIASSQFEKARPIIDAVRQKGDGLDSASLDARWYDAQRQYDRAKSTLESFVKGVDPAKSGTQAVRSLADFLWTHGEQDAAITALEGARAHQDPKGMEIDRSIAVLQRQRGKIDECVASLRRIIDAKADDESQSLRKNIAEILIQANKLEEADKEMAALASVDRLDATVCLLRARLADARKDARGARAALTDAVTRFPQDPRTFVARAQFFIEREGNVNSAIEDLDKAIALRPRSIDLLTLRARASVAAERPEDAMRDLREMARISPNDPVVRSTLLVNLMDLGRVDEAANDGQRLFEAAGGKADVATEIGGVFARYARWDKASIFYSVAYKLSKTPDAAATLINSLLNQTPPEGSQAGTILAEVTDQADKNVALAVAKARWFSNQKDRVKARESLTVALRQLNPENPDQMLGWYATLAAILTDRAEMLPYLDQQEKAGLAPLWMQWFRANVHFNSPDTRDQAVAEFRAFTDPSKPAFIRQLTFKAMTRAFSGQGKSAEAVEWARQGIAQFTDDVELLNNAAYILAKDLKKPEEALELAQRAAKLAPNDPNAQDTLGCVLLARGKNAEARDQLQRALAMAARNSPPATNVTISVHLAQACVALKDMDIAKNLVANARAMAKQAPAGIPKDVLTDLDELENRVK